MPSIHKWMHSGLGGVPLSAILWWRGYSLTPKETDLSSLLHPPPTHPHLQARAGWAGLQGVWPTAGRVTGWAHRDPCQLSQSPLFGEEPPAPEREVIREFQLAWLFLPTGGTWPASDLTLTSRPGQQIRCRTGQWACPQRKWARGIG